MSQRSGWDDAQVYAYVDGMLDADTAARLEADARTDAALASRVARQRELRSALRAKFDPVLDEAIPQRLHDALAGPGAGAAVTPIGAAGKARDRAARPAWSVREWVAVAATLIVGVLVGLAFRGSDGLPIETRDGGFVAAGYLDAALSEQLSGGAEKSARAHIGLSFRAAGGEYCRTFALRGGADGLACRRGGRWSVDLLEGAASQSPASEGFRQASSALSPALLGAVNALGAGEPLTPEQERRQLESGWDAPGP